MTGWFARRFGARKTVQMEVQFIGCIHTQAFLELVFRQMNVRIMDVDFSAESCREGMRYTNVYTLEIPREMDGSECIRSALLAHASVKSARMIS